MKKRKKCLILVPHQDDEIILCGAFLKSMIESGIDVYVVFMTNGDYEEKIGKTRLQESIEALSIYGLPEEKIIFMGYANEYSKNVPHIYNAVENKLVESQYGNAKTYGLAGHPEFCYLNKGIHHEYRRNNLVEDLREIIVSIMPDIIFATDMEIHPDHQANSLFLDEVLGMVLKEKENFRPFLLKKPEYRTAWHADPDYSVVNNKASVLKNAVYVNGERSQFQNPYIRWNDRVRIPVDMASRVTKKDNIVWKALQKYKSQNAKMNFEKMMNSDVVYWNRRTDSLTYGAKITVSSGKAEYLNDFKIVDAGDISRKNYEYVDIKESIWHPDSTDRAPYIEIDLKSEKIISEVVIYQEFCPSKEILNGRLILDGNITIPVGRLEKRKETSIQFPPIPCRKIVYMIDSCTDGGGVLGISEIEVYEEKKYKTEFIKLQINNNFIYEYNTGQNLKGKLSAYSIDSSGKAHVFSAEELNIVITDYEGKRVGTEVYLDRGGYLKGRVNKYIDIYAELQENPSVCDRIRIFENGAGVKRCLQEYVMLLNADIPMEMIEQLQFATGKARLEMIKKLYRVVAVNEKYSTGIYLKKMFLTSFSKLARCEKLTLQEERDAYCFLALGEAIPRCSKYIKEYFFTSNHAEEDTEWKPKIYFIGTPDHNNIGDHIIAYVTELFLKDVLPDKEIVEVSMKNFPGKLRWLKQIITDRDLIILQGGGNMGNIYWRNERIRREVIGSFRKNKIIIFPETMYYEDTIFGAVELKESVRIYNRAANLNICAREQVSFEQMKQNYPNCKVILVPDIVCYYRLMIADLNKKGVLLFVRKDLEASIDPADVAGIEKILQEKHMDFHYSDMLRTQKGYIGKANRKRVVENKIREIAGAQLVITDRLHAMILSAVTATPCIAFGGYNHKIESTYHTWFENLKYIYLVHNITEFEGKLQELLVQDNKPDINEVNFKLDFLQLITLVKEEEV